VPRVVQYSRVDEPRMSRVVRYSRVDDPGAT